MLTNKRETKLRLVSDDRTTKSSAGVVRFRKGLLLALWIGLFLAGGLIIAHFGKGSALSAKGASPRLTNQAASTSGEEIQVDVHGDVRRPGIVKVRSGARVVDVIRAAGGLLHTSDANNLNEAAVVYDGEEIDVLQANAPKAKTQTGLSENSSISAFSSTSSTSSADNAKTLATSKINLNSADVSTLETLPGIGPKRANDIVNYRKAHGPFHSLSDLLNVKGIGEKTMQAWQKYLYVTK